MKKLTTLLFTSYPPFGAVFRTNSCYARWWEARGCWGLIINHSRNIMRMSTSWTLQGATPENKEKREKQLNELALSVWEFPRSLTRHLLRGEEDEIPFAADVRERLHPDIAEKLISVRHRPTKALYDLSKSVDALNLTFIKRLEIDKSITVLCDQAGACERILSAPIPLFYTR
jgi:putative membrane protein